MHINRIVVLLLACFLLASLAAVAQSAWYKAPILHQQAVTKLLKRGDIVWGDLDYDDYNFGNVLVSGDGTRLLFTGNCYWCVPSEVRPFLIDPDGSDLQDISGMLPADITNRWSAWRNLVINDDASKIFYRAFVETGYYDDQRIFVYDIASTGLSLALNQQNIGSLDTGWRFRTDEKGETVYLDKLNAGYDPALKKNRKGLFYNPTGGTKNWFLDVDDLPCESECGNLNMMKVLGFSVRNDRAFFRWNSDYRRGDGLYHEGLWFSGLDGNPVLLGEEHFSIRDGDPRGISNTDGTSILYAYRHLKGDPLNLAVVSVPSGEETVVGWTSGLNGFEPHLTRSGRYALVKGEYGDYGTYYQTMIDLQTGTSRDTWSYYLPTQWGSTSNITSDDRFYFHTIDGWPNSEGDVGLYRIDMKTTGDDQAPFVKAIAFNAPALVDADSATIGIRVVVSDPQGQDNIEWVRLTPLVDGQEEPSWAMGREPLAFPVGDPGSVLLRDDGTQGDETAGDGIYAFSQIATRKGDRQEGGFNAWFQHFTLPAPVGIRIIVKDADNNYAIADAELTIADIFAEADQVRLAPDESASQITIVGIGPPYQVVTDKPGVVSTRVDGNTLSITALKAGKTVLTVSDAMGNQFDITVFVTAGMEALVPLFDLLFH